MNPKVDLSAEVDRMGDRIQELLVKLSRSPEDLIRKLLDRGYVFDLYYTQSGCRLFLESDTADDESLSFHGATDVEALQQAVDYIIPRGVDNVTTHPGNYHLPASHRPR